MKININIFLLKMIVCCTVVFNSALLFSQEGREQDILIKKAQELVFSNPDESVKIANHLLKKELSDNELSAINVLMAKSYIVKGDYTKAVERIFEADAKSSNAGNPLKFDILLVKAEIAGTLHLDKQLKHYTRAIKTMIGKCDTGDVKKGMELKFALERAKVRLVRQNYAEAIKLIDSLQEASTAPTGKDFDPILQLAIYKGMANYGIENYDDAGKELQNALALYTEQNSTNVLYKIYIHYILGNLYFQDEEYNKAIDALHISLVEAKKIENIPLIKDINNQLGISYLALNNKAEHQKYNSEFLSQIVTVENMETAAVNSMYGLIAKEQEAYYEGKKDKYSTYINIAVTGLVVLIIFGIALYLTNQSRKRRLKEIISYLELSNNLMPKFEPVKKEPNKKLLIPTETEQNILAKLRKFENSTKFTNKDMSLATLAAQLDVNTKYLSEVINKHYNDNFNTYINKLRINYIIEKLKNHPEYLHYKISYLAEESGFSSHSSFATVFKTITGIAPTTFIDLLGEEISVKKA